MIVTPAEAGVQGVKLILRCRFKPWIPAFAGMTDLTFTCVHFS